VKNIQTVFQSVKLDVDFCTKYRIGITFAHFSKSGKSIQLRWNFAGAGFLLDLETRNSSRDENIRT